MALATIAHALGDPWRDPLTRRALLEITLLLMLVTWPSQASGQSVSSVVKAVPQPCTTQNIRGIPEIDPKFFL